MTTTQSTYERELWRILEKNRLGDLSQYHVPNFYDEVPLYTRLADISFLSDGSTDRANAILLRFALKFLKSVISYEEHDSPFFAAITVSEYAPGEPIVPNLFVWSDPALALYEKLTLVEATTPIGKKIKRQVGRLDLPDLYAVFEEAGTTPESPRVFISPLHPPYPGFVPVYMFCKHRNDIVQAAPMKPARRTTR